ncbi:MAG: serine hydrolase domain-containing protein [Phycisphaerales bacterium]
MGFQASISITLTLIVFLGAAPSWALSPAASSDPADVSTFAESSRQALGVPGFAIAATDSEGLIGWGVGGKRSAQANDPIQRTDRFHIGSITKSMTATIIGCYVERGDLTWDSTIAQLDPKLAENIPETARTITIRQLLSHRAGLSDDRGGGRLLIQMWGLEGPMIEQRAKISQAALNGTNNKAPGSRFEYSNAGYIIAGHMLERVTGEPWETIIERELFEPLGMTSAGQGPPGMDPADGDQPLGHGGAPGNLNSIPAVLGADNPPPLGPAGRVHCSIEDLARYAREHLRGLRGKDGVVEAATFQTLHEDTDSDGYALGWGIVGEGPERRSTHSGSNTRWLAVVVVWPGRDLAMVVAMNAWPQGSEVDVLGNFAEYLTQLDLVEPWPNTSIEPDSSP